MTVFRQKGGASSISQIIELREVEVDGNRKSEFPQIRIANQVFFSTANKKEENHDGYPVAIKNRYMLHFCIFVQTLQFLEGFMLLKRQ